MEIGAKTTSAEQVQPLRQTKAPVTVVLEKEFESPETAIREAKCLNPNLKNIPRTMEGFRQSGIGTPKCGVTTVSGGDNSKPQEIAYYSTPLDTANFRMILSDSKTKVRVEFKTLNPFRSGMLQRFIDNGWRRHPPLV